MSLTSERERVEEDGLFGLVVDILVAEPPVDHGQAEHEDEQSPGHGGGEAESAGVEAFAIDEKAEAKPLEKMTKAELL